MPTLYADGGADPDLVFTSGKVFVNYIGNDFEMPVNRDKTFGNPWNNPEDIPFDELPLTNRVISVKPLIIGNELNTVYVNGWASFNHSGFLISHSYKNIYGTSWTQNPVYLNTDQIVPNVIYPSVSTSTPNGKIHLIYWDKDLSLFSYRQINNHTFSNHIASIPLAGYLSNVLITNANDLYLLKTGNIDVPGKIHFRHYDTNPLPPQNLQVTHSQNNHPYLTWSANKETDFNYYIIEKSYSTISWDFVEQTSNTYCEDTEESFCMAPPPAQCSGERTVYYRVTAVDKHPYSSIPSEVRTVVLGYPYKEISQISEIPDEYKLTQNYPNPFNPSTLISYSLKAPGYVKLTVYDMLGREVAELVNENQTEGNYTVEFTSKNLPSGIYIYRLNAGKFSDIKKMSLLK